METKVEMKTEISMSHSNYRNSKDSNNLQEKEEGRRDLKTEKKIITNPIRTQMKMRFMRKRREEGAVQRVPEIRRILRRLSRLHKST